METGYIIQLWENGRWQDSIWTNNFLAEDEIVAEDLPIRVSLTVAKKSLKLAEEKFPEFKYRIFPEPKPTNPIINALEKELEDTKETYKDHNLHSTYADGYLAGLFRMIVIAKDALEKEASKVEVAVDPNPILEALQKCHNKINERAQIWSLRGLGHRDTSRVLCAELNGATDMLDAAKEAASKYEKTHINTAALMRLFCTGQIIHNEAKELLETFETLFPSAVSVQREPSTAKCTYQPIPLDKDTRRA